jgi:hypothetical protein
MKTEDGKYNFSLLHKVSVADLLSRSYLKYTAGPAGRSSRLTGSLTLINKTGKNVHPAEGREFHCHIKADRLLILEWYLYPELEIVARKSCPTDRSDWKA